MNFSTRAALAMTCTLMLAAGCSSERKDGAEEPQDPAIAGALGDQIMVDPAMSGANGSAVAPGTGQVELPPQQRSPEAVQAARDEASVLAGGTLKAAPAAQAGSASSLVESAATAAQVAQAAKATRTDCAQKAQYSATWAAKLPKELPVYPRGAVQEAAGTDRDGCRLRVVNFVTPVPLGEVVDFYYTKATASGFGAEYRKDGQDHVLGGKKAGGAYLIYMRKQANGLTEVDLIAAGA